MYFHKKNEGNLNFLLAEQEQIYSSFELSQRPIETTLFFA